PSARPRHERMPRARSPPEGAAPAWRVVRSWGVEKVYWAVVEGQPGQPEGRIETGLKKLIRGTGWRMIVDPASQKAITDYRVRGAAEGRAWLELRPRTGRTHQLRVRCAALGCPVVGDAAYGK